VLRAESVKVHDLDTLPWVEVIADELVRRLNVKDDAAPGLSKAMNPHRGPQLIGHQKAAGRLALNQQTHGLAGC